MKTRDLKVQWMTIREATRSFFGLSFSNRDAYLDYSVQKAATAYDDGTICWIYQENDQGSRVPVAYHVVHDYRRSSYEGGVWGRAQITGTYDFPGELVEHREAMITRMTGEKRIKKDSRCPRVAAVRLGNVVPEFDIEIASYHGQVGTNLTLDHRLPSAIDIASTSCVTVREWDRAQAGFTGRGLPDWERSRLANTIGVGVALSARSKSGLKYYVSRFRTPNAPVYPNCWHLPVSFALEVNESLQPAFPI